MTHLSSLIHTLTHKKVLGTLLKNYRYSKPKNTHLRVRYTKNTHTHPPTVVLLINRHKTWTNWFIFPSQEASVGAEVRYHHIPVYSRGHTALGGMDGRVTLHTNTHTQVQTLHYQKHLDKQKEVATHVSVHLAEHSCSHRLMYQSAKRSNRIRTATQECKKIKLFERGYQNMV